mgnify:CR=1 FL=1
MSLFAFSKQLMSAAEWSFSDNVLPNAAIFELQIRCGGTVVSSPIEAGSFISYNKTNEPMEINSTLAFSGSDSFLQSVLDSLNALKTSVTTFSIQTPLYEYENFTLQNYDYSMRREDGRGVLYVNALFLEIREVQLSYTDTDITETDSKDPSAVSNSNGGLKQAQTPSSTEQSAGNRSRRSVLRSMGVGG